MAVKRMDFFRELQADGVIKKGQRLPYGMSDFFLAGLAGQISNMLKTGMTYKLIYMFFLENKEIPEELNYQRFYRWVKKNCINISKKNDGADI